MRILLTTCSYQDTPGPHHELMESQGWEIVRERGPLPEARMLELAGYRVLVAAGADAALRVCRAHDGPIHRAQPVRV